MGWTLTVSGLGALPLPLLSTAVSVAEELASFGTFVARSSSSRDLRTALAASSISLLFRLLVANVLVPGSRVLILFEVVSKAFVSRALDSHDVDVRLPSDGAAAVPAEELTTASPGARNDLRRGDGAGSPVNCDKIGRAHV